MDETLTNIQIFERDADRLVKLFGKPMKRAFRLALGKVGCSHPEGMRTYTSALIRPDGQPFTADASDYKTVSGFLCGACGNYVFPDTNNEAQE